MDTTELIVRRNIETGMWEVLHPTMFGDDCNDGFVLHRAVDKCRLIALMKSIDPNVKYRVVSE